MIQDSQILKMRLINLLDFLPMESLKILVEFAEFLRAQVTPKLEIPAWDLDLKQLQQQELTHLEEEFAAYEQLYRSIKLTHLRHDTINDVYFLLH